MSGREADVAFSGIRVNVVSDGSFLRDGGPVFGTVPKVLWERSVKPDRKNRVRMGLNCLLIRTPDANVLVDCGIGNKEPDISKEIYGHSSSKLLRNLRAEGLAARDIDWVVLTHLHFDHCGGATRLDREGNIVPTFPKAKYLVQRNSWAEAFDQSERVLASYGGECSHLKVIEDRGQIELLDGDTEIVPGVKTSVMDGHADGHQIVTVNAGSERVAFLSDLIPTPNHIPLPYIAAFDKTPEGSLHQKKEMLERCEREGSLMVFAHGYGDRAGYLQRGRQGVTLNPVAI